MTTKITSMVLCLAITVFAQSLNADEYAGKATPARQRVSYDQIDHSVYDQLLQKYVDTDGMVNYAAWQADATDRDHLRVYLEQLSTASSQIQGTEPARIAYWINAYNALTIEGILRVYPTTSIRNHTPAIGYNLWKNLYLHVEDSAISLDKIEHEVLRPAGDPRVHFAIVCASIGCPRLLNRAYNGQQLEEQLVHNTQDFFSRQQNLRVDAQSRTLYLSAILDWFKQDFGNTQNEQLTAIAPYFPENAKQFVSQGGFRVAYSDYDWNLNTQPAGVQANARGGASGSGGR